MGFRIEISFDLRKRKNMTETKNLIINYAFNNMCESYFSEHEIYGKNRKIHRNHYIMTFLFAESDKKVATFLRNIKNTTNVYIESVGYDNIIYKLMWASKKYLNMLDKGIARQYLTNRKNNNLFMKESVIYNAIKGC